MHLSNQQLNLFKTFGFLKIPSLFLDNIQHITDEFELIWGAENHDHKTRSILVPFIERSKYLTELLDDPRIEETVGSILGNDFNYTVSDGNLYSGHTTWHSDGFGRHPGYTSIKIALYLDIVTATTGCLRVIPGSHEPGDIFSNTLEHIIPDTTSKEKLEEIVVDKNQKASVNYIHDKWKMPEIEVPAVPLESIPGDILIFNHRIKHSSFGGSQRRRMFTMNFEERYHEDDLDMLSDEFSLNLPFGIKQPYLNEIVDTSNRKRMVHLEQRLANAHYIDKLINDSDDSS